METNIFPFYIHCKTQQNTTNYSKLPRKQQQTTPKHDKLLQNTTNTTNTTNYCKTTTNYSKTRQTTPKQQQTTPKHHKLLQNTTNYSKTTINYSKTPQTTPKHHKLPPNTTNYPQIQQTTPKYDKLLQNNKLPHFEDSVQRCLPNSTIPQDVVAASLRTKEVVQSTNGNIVGKDTMQNAMEQRVSRASTNVSQRYT